MSKTICARTMTDLKHKLRKHFGWPDRRTWTASERAYLNNHYNLRVDYKTGKFVAEPRKSIDAL